MSWIRVILALGLILSGAASASAQRMLYVNAATGNDSVSKANNSAATPWRTIGRAVWGSVNRSAPSSSEAATAGDTVVVAGGTYTTSVSVNDRWGVVYNPANSGTAANPITITCVGTCILGAPNAYAPVIGSTERNYIKWYADIAQAHTWQITADGRRSGDATTTQVKTTPDTGPVVCHAGTGCWIEGASIDGGVQIDYTDNWNGVRVENCSGCVVRNNSIRNFRNARNGSNGTAVTLYGSSDAIVEHNFATNMASGVAFKDKDITPMQRGIRVRYNLIEGVDRCFLFSLIKPEERNYVYQNVCSNAGFGLFVTGQGLSNDWVFNNTFYNLSAAGLYPNPAGFGGRFWNNVVVNADRIVLSEGGPMPAEAVIDVEHNVYYSYSQFYAGPDGNRSFSAFRDAFGHDRAAPASVDANPVFVNPGGGDFRVCTGPGSPAARCAGASAATGRGVDIFDLDADGNTTEVIRAGAYVSNAETIGPIGGVPVAPRNLRVTGS